MTSTTIYEIFGAIVITLIAVMGKLVEQSAHFHAIQSGRQSGGTVAAYYECCNFHLHLSLGMLGLAWSQHWDTPLCVPLIIMIFLGIITKGVFASTPTTLRFRDRSALLGLYIPNTLALLCVIWAIGGKHLMVTDKSNAPAAASRMVAPATLTDAPTNN